MHCNKRRQKTKSKTTPDFIFFSNVVEKCVSNALSDERAALIREVCQPEGGDRYDDDHNDDDDDDDGDDDNGDNADQRGLSTRGRRQV